MVNVRNPVVVRIQNYFVGILRNLLFNDQTLKDPVPCKDTLVENDVPINIHLEDGMVQVENPNLARVERKVSIEMDIRTFILKDKVKEVKVPENIEVSGILNDKVTVEQT